LQKSRPRLKDIAVATGYSANTVSLALRGSPRIPEETRDRIQSAARSLNYLPNTIAQALVSRETMTIGLVLTDIMNPTLTLVARFLERELAQRGYSLMLAASDHDAAKERSALEVFRSRQVDGILIYPTNHERLEHIRAVRQAGYPVLVLADIPFSGLDVVAINDRSGAYRAVQHLIQRGHRRIAMLDAAQLLGNSEKQDGALRAVVDAGLPAAALAVFRPGGHSSTDGFRAIAEAMKLQDRPTALFATTDSLAIGALRWCREQGLSVPGGLAIVGYDNTEAADFSSVPMTSVNYAAAEVSRHAVDRILSLMGRASPPAPLVTLIDPELIVRESS
jgi:LacI family transcriptional regulator